MTGGRERIDPCRGDRQPLLYDGYGRHVLWRNEGHEVGILICSLCDGVGGIEAQFIKSHGFVNTIIASQIEAKRGITASEMQHIYSSTSRDFLKRSVRWPSGERCWLFVVILGRQVHCNGRYRDTEC